MTDAKPLSATALRDAIRNGETTAAELWDGCRDTIAAKDPEIRAFVSLKDAPNDTNASGPLSGLPVAVKDIYDTADLPTGYGSPIYQGNQPAWDAATVAFTRAAGGQVIGKTVTTEFAYFFPGPTRNPRDPRRTPGGSSSGSAAAVAAGMVPLAFATQTAGSTIRPASYCGIAGYKPSFGLLPTVGIKTFAWSLDTVGLYGAKVADTAFFASALTGRHLEIGDEVPAPRIGLLRTHLWHEASDEMQAAIESAAGDAERAGATVGDVEMPEILARADEAHGVIFAHEGAHALAHERRLHRDRLSDVLNTLLDTGEGFTPEDHDRARATAKKARLQLLDVFRRYDVLLTPAAPGVAPMGIEATGTPQFNRLWTLMGNPAISVPGKENAEGLPLGVQIVGPAGADAETLAAAHWLERAMRG